jgi:hypothetical protein
MNYICILRALSFLFRVRVAGLTYVAESFELANQNFSFTRTAIPCPAQSHHSILDYDRPTTSMTSSLYICIMPHNALCKNIGWQNYRAIAHSIL